MEFRIFLTREFTIRVAFPEKFHESSWQFKNSRSLLLPLTAPLVLKTIWIFAI
jgi:hypothetical protein